MYDNNGRIASYLPLANEKVFGSLNQARQYFLNSLSTNKILFHYESKQF